MYRDKEDVVTTLAICALLTNDANAVRQCALTLAEDCAPALQKSLLTPLAMTEDALDIVVNEYVYPTKELRLGFAWRENFEYEIFAIYHDNLDYEVKDVVSLVASTFVDWGVAEGSVKMRILHPTDGSFGYKYANLATFAYNQFDQLQAA